MLHVLGHERQLPAFKASQSMLPRLADQGQLLVLACALTQVCLLPCIPPIAERISSSFVTLHDPLNARGSDA